MYLYLCIYLFIYLHYSYIIIHMSHAHRCACVYMSLSLPLSPSPSPSVQSQTKGEPTAQPPPQIMCQLASSVASRVMSYVCPYLLMFIFMNLHLRCILISPFFEHSCNFLWVTLPESSATHAAPPVASAAGAREGHRSVWVGIGQNVSSLSSLSLPPVLEMIFSSTSGPRQTKSNEYGICRLLWMKIPPTWLSSLGNLGSQGSQPQRGGCWNWWKRVTTPNISGIDGWEVGYNSLCKQLGY